MCPRDSGCCNGDPGGLFRGFGSATRSSGGGGSWSVGEVHSTRWVRYGFANDQKCGGSATDTQWGSFSMYAHVTSTVYLRVTSFGVAESQYERFDMVRDTAVTPSRL